MGVLGGYTLHAVDTKGLIGVVAASFTAVIAKTVSGIDTEAVFARFIRVFGFATTIAFFGLVGFFGFHDYRIAGYWV